METETTGNNWFRKHKRKGYLLLIGAPLLVLILMLPLGMPGVDTYFTSDTTRRLNSDEVGQMTNVRAMYQKMANRGDDFQGWNTEAQDFWKYTIAFSAYGLPSAMILDPENSDAYRLLFDTMIWKMKSKRVWGDFTDRGFGPDPITFQNIMYKGHLNLMFGLYQLSTGDVRYAREFTWLTKQLAEEMRLHHEGIYEGVTCEPNAWFVECNTIGMLSMLIYDRIYGTKYAENEVQWSLDFILTRMRDESSGLFYKSYHPHQDVVVKDTLGYANAWILTFLNPLLSEEMERTYENAFKDKLVINYGPLYASVRHDTHSKTGSDRIAHVFGLWVAKEFNDPRLFGKLRNSLDKFGKLEANKEIGGLNYAAAGEDANAINGVVLGAKLHLGWNTVLNYPWGHTLPNDIPDTAGITWRDILPDRVYSMSNGQNPLPKNSILKRPCPNCYWGDYKSIQTQHAIKKLTACPATSESQDQSCGMDVLTKETLIHEDP